MIDYRRSVQVVVPKLNANLFCSATDKRSVGSLEHFWTGKRVHCDGHHAPVCEETILVKQCMELFDSRPEGVLEIVGVEQLVVYYL